MSLKRHVCRLGRNAASSEHIWIGDDVLDAALQRFGRLAVVKRKVSFAPGPLEARKRASKRRLAHLSSSGGGGLGQIDPSLLTEVNEKAREGQWHWQAPEKSKQAEPLSLPPWLANLIHQPTAFPAPAKQPEIQALGPQLIEPSSRISKDTFLRKLKSCRDLTGLRNLAFIHDIDVRNYSKIAFRQLYDLQKPLSEHLDFLQDPLLDDPHAQNLQYLLGHLSKQLKIDAALGRMHVILELRNTLIPWVKSQLSLGRRHEADIVDLATFFGDLAQHDHSETLGRDIAVVALSRDIAIAALEGVRSSTVLGLRDIAPKNCEHLLESVMKGPLNLELQDLGLSIMEKVTNTRLVSRFLGKCIHSRPASHGLDEVRAWQQIIFPRISKLLQDRSRAGAKKIVQNTSRLLVNWQANLPYNSRLCAGLMDQWWSVIAKIILPDFSNHGLGSLKVERSMPFDRPDTLASYASHLGGRKKARFVLSNWFIGRLSLQNFQKLSQALAHNFEKDSNDSPFLCMLKTVREQDILDDDFLRHTFLLLERMRMYGVMTSILVQTRETGITIPSSAVQYAIRHLLKVSPKQAYRIFRCDARLPLESFPTLAENLIAYPRLHPKLVWHYRQKRQAMVVFNAHAHDPEWIRKGRTRLLDAMAMAYSRASHLTHRIAYRQVMRCVNCYDREKLGPLSPTISRALIRTGIIRPLQDGRVVSIEKLTWILAVTREAEGPDKADQIDHIVQVWRTQVKHQTRPNWNHERDLLHRGEEKDFFISRRWSKTHHRYDKVMLPALRPGDRTSSISQYKTSVTGVDKKNSPIVGFQEGPSPGQRAGPQSRRPAITAPKRHQRTTPVQRSENPPTEYNPHLVVDKKVLVVQESALPPQSGPVTKC